MRHNKHALKIAVALAALILLRPHTPVAATPPPSTQLQSEENLVYTVQPGDTLISIALKYNLNLTQLLLANNLFDPNLIFPGQTLILPGIPAPNPTPTPVPMPLSDEPYIVQPGDTLFGIAGKYNVSLGSLTLANSLLNPDVIEVGQVLQIPVGPPPTPGPLLPPFESVEFSESSIFQGRTLAVRVNLTEPAALSGSFEGQPLFFYGKTQNQLWGLVAIHALLEPKTYPLVLTATWPDGSEVTRIENVTIFEGPYGTENIQFDTQRGELLDPDLIVLEREKLLDLWSRVSQRPRWEGTFWYPVAGDSVRVTSYFGTRRTYNGSTELSFHGGADFGGGIGAPIYAPAAGRVVLAETLTVRGNAVLIDHGMGLYSGYWHQSRLAVRQGQEVERGDLIGYIGDTGLVTGPHLHWEMRLNGIAVNPLQWVRESIP